jgi:MoxR-like ATPase
VEVPALEHLTIDWLGEAFERDGYISDNSIITTIYLALRLGKPLLVEGAPGVGKTEIAKVLSRIFRTDLIRLQCYEGLDENKALYEWNYQKQLLSIEQAKVTPAGEGGPQEDLFSETYLLERPLLRAIRAASRPVLLIDEVDKTDEEFEAFLFEVLSDFTVSVPELGTMVARQVPMVILTSNNERELSDGLKRRCAYLHIDFPTVEKEIRIINTKVPEAGVRLSEEIAIAVNYIRYYLEVRKKPSIAETLDWARALVTLNADRLSDDLLHATISFLLKTKEDLGVFSERTRSESIMGFVWSQIGTPQTSAAAAPRPNISSRTLGAPTPARHEPGSVARGAPAPTPTSPAENLGVSKGGARTAKKPPTKWR